MAAPPCPELDTIRLPLAERHLAELRASAVPDDVIAERGCWTATHPVQLHDLGFADYQCRAPAIVFPLHGPDGSNSRYAIKPDYPRVEQRPDKPDRPIKYEYPAGLPPIIDVPPRCLPMVSDATVPLGFTEGAKKADCWAALGDVCAINLWGVHNWYTNPEHGGFATIEPLPDWAPIVATLDGRICYLAFDSDAWSSDPKKASVGLALRRLANFLARHGALVYVVHLPDSADGAKLGLDDFIAEHGADAFAELVQDAAPWGSIAMVRKLQARVQELEQLVSAQAAVLRNPALRPTQKVVAIATVNEAGWRASTGALAPYRVNASRVAAAAGVSPQTASSAIKALSEPDGLFEKRVTREYYEDVGWRSTMELTPRRNGGVVDLLKATAELRPERPSWGGKRTPRCPDHPDAVLVGREVLLHFGCGCVVAEPQALNSQLGSSAEDEACDPRADPGALNCQVHSSDQEPSNLSRTREGSPYARTYSGQVDHSALEAPRRCSQCGHQLFPDEKGVCDGCASRQVLA